MGTVLAKKDKNLTIDPKISSFLRVCYLAKAKQNNTFVSCNIGLQNRVGR